MKHHMTTYVSVPEEGGDHALVQAAINNLGGGDGLQCVSRHLSKGMICATFVRDWEEPDPTDPPYATIIPERVTHTEPEEGEDNELA